MSSNVNMPKKDNLYVKGDYIIDRNGRSCCLQRIDGVTIMPAPDEGSDEEPRFYYIIKENKVGESYGMSHGVYDSELIEYIYRKATDVEITLYA